MPKSKKPIKGLTAAGFRRVVLGLPNVVEGAHMGHPDFRVNGRVFASLHADLEWGMVKLTPDEQQRFLAEHPDSFAPESGAWGRQGYTAVRLDTIDEEVLGEAATLAWRSTSALAPARKRTATTSQGRKKPSLPSTRARR